MSEYFSFLPCCLSFSRRPPSITYQSFTHRSLTYSFVRYVRIYHTRSCPALVYYISRLVVMAQDFADGIGQSRKHLSRPPSSFTCLRISPSSHSAQPNFSRSYQHRRARRGWMAQDDPLRTSSRPEAESIQVMSWCWHYSCHRHSQL